MGYHGFRNQHNPKYTKVYAEKYIYMRDDMYAPMHYHDYKSEDIINRGGGDLKIKVFLDDGKGGLSDKDVEVQSDGRRYMVPAGTSVLLKPGQSITIYPHLYHEFHGVPGTGNMKFPSAMTMSTTISSMTNVSEDSRPSTRMNLRIGCCAMNIRQQWTEREE